MQVWGLANCCERVPGSYQPLVNCSGLRNCSSCLRLMHICLEYITALNKTFCVWVRFWEFCQHCGIWCFESETGKICVIFLFYFWCLQFCCPLSVFYQLWSFRVGFVVFKFNSWIYFLITAADCIQSYGGASVYKWQHKMLSVFSFICVAYLHLWMCQQQLC